jgi:hypothetical protein
VFLKGSQHREASIVSEQQGFLNLSIESHGDHGTQGDDLRSFAPSVAACCKVLEHAFVEYAAFLDEVLRRIDDPDLIPGSLLEGREAQANWLAALADLAECPSRTWSDLVCKQAAIEPWLDFSRQYPGLMDQIATGMLCDISRIARSDAQRRTTWKFPSLPLPSSWSFRSRPRQSNNPRHP